MRDGDAVTAERPTSESVAYNELLTHNVVAYSIASSDVTVYVGVKRLAESAFGMPCVSDALCIILPVECRPTTSEL